MQIIFRPIEHRFYDPNKEIEVQSVSITDIDAVSATANIGGFVPLRSIAYEYGWDTKILKVAVKECNERGEVVILNQLKPTLFLVPKNKDKSNTLFYITDLLNAMNHLDIKTVRFTHHFFLFGNLREDEIPTILEVMLNPLTKSTLKKVIWDIDTRQELQMTKLYLDIKSRLRLSNEA
jgi:hypothetical protein